MKITEIIFAQLTDTDTILESVYQAIADVDPNYADEMATYEQGIQAYCRQYPTQKATCRPDSRSWHLIFFSPCGRALCGVWIASATQSTSC